MTRSVESISGKSTKMRGYYRNTAVIMTLILLISLAGSAIGATLQITGDPGVAISINGTLYGYLPLGDLITLEPGVHIIGGHLPGTHEFLREIEINSSADVMQMRLDMIPLNHRDAVIYSLLLAGTGQRYLGRTKSGWLMTAGEVGGFLVALISEMKMQNNRDDYLRARQGYATAITLPEIERLRTEMDSTWRNMQDAESLRDSATRIAWITLGLSVLDAWLRFPSFEAGPGALPRTTGINSTTIHGESTAFHMGLGFKF